MKLSVVIVSYKVKYYLEQCLLALRKATDGVDTEVFVVDNHSGDGSVEYLKKRFHNVAFISSHHNLGFAKANNRAIRRSKGEYVLLLNPDTIVAEDAIKQCLDFMDTNPQAGSCGIRMLHDDGTNAPESRRGLPSPLTAFYKMCGLCSRYPDHPKFGRYYMGGLPWDSPQEIEVVSGAFCMLRKSVIDEIGGLDEDFFMYGEDIDLSYRIMKGGWKNYYIPAQMLHYKGESTQKSSFRYVHVFYNSMLIFFRKHYAHFSLWASLPINIAIYGKALAALMKIQAHAIYKSLGFFVGRRHKEAAYIFIGNSIDDYKKLADSNGLEAQFFDGNGSTMPRGHLQIGMPEQVATQRFARKVTAGRTTSKESIVVYDTEAYTYGQILGIFASNPQPGVRIGTYNPSNHTLITTEDVLLME